MNPRLPVRRVGSARSNSVRHADTLMKIGLAIIGDEILSGRRQDRHLSAVIEILKQRSLSLAWCRIYGDDLSMLAEGFRQTMAAGDVVLCTGGIGATPDDLTRQALALAANVPLQQHPEGVALLKARKDYALTEQRLRMVEFPRGAQLIPNPINQVPGFSFQNHHCVPGFPQMAWPMLAWVLDTYYAQFIPNLQSELALQVTGAEESSLIPLMESIMRDYPGVRIFSLPTLEGSERMIELGVKGAPAMTQAALVALKAGLDALQRAWR